MDTVLLELFSTSSLKRTKLAPRMGCEIGTIKVAVSLTCCARTSGADSRDNANKQSKRAFMVSPPQGLASNDPRHTICSDYAKRCPTNRELCRGGEVLVCSRAGGAA